MLHWWSFNQHGAVIFASRKKEDEINLSDLGAGYVQKFGIIDARDAR
jgi:hypothetical protein